MRYQPPANKRASIKKKRQDGRGGRTVASSATNTSNEREKKQQKKKKVEEKTRRQRKRKKEREREREEGCTELREDYRYNASIKHSLPK